MRLTVEHVWCVCPWHVPARIVKNSDGIGFHKVLDPLGDSTLGFFSFSGLMQYCRDQGYVIAYEITQGKGRFMLTK